MLEVVAQDESIDARRSGSNLDDSFNEILQMKFYNPTTTNSDGFLQTDLQARNREQPVNKVLFHEPQRLEKKSTPTFTQIHPTLNIVSPDPKVQKQAPKQSVLQQEITIKPEIVHMQRTPEVKTVFEMKRCPESPNAHVTLESAYMKAPVQPLPKSISFGSGSKGSDRESAHFFQLDDKDKFKIYNLQLNNGKSAANSDGATSLELSRHGELLYLFGENGLEVVNVFTKKSFGNGLDTSKQFLSRIQRQLYQINPEWWLPPPTKRS